MLWGLARETVNDYILFAGKCSLYDVVLRTSLFIICSRMYGMCTMFIVEKAVKLCRRNTHAVVDFFSTSTEKGTAL